MKKSLTGPIRSIAMGVIASSLALTVLGCYGGHKVPRPYRKPEHYTSSKPTSNSSSNSHYYSNSSYNYRYSYPRARTSRKINSLGYRVYGSPSNSRGLLASSKPHRRYTHPIIVRPQGPSKGNKRSSTSRKSPRTRSQRKRIMR
tara:strand:+ start:401 stop:832 length:432 start_codon:yes stop_codon:yes gene_type:complete